MHRARIFTPVTLVFPLHLKILFIGALLSQVSYNMAILLGIIVVSCAGHTDDNCFPFVAVIDASVK